MNGGVVTDGERCAGCGVRMPDRSPNSPAVRRCEACWWAHNTAERLAGHAVYPLTEPVLRRTHGDQPKSRS
jgi:hypothetical protein